MAGSACSFIWLAVSDIACETASEMVSNTWSAEAKRMFLKVDIPASLALW